MACSTSSECSYLYDENERQQRSEDVEHAVVLCADAAATEEGHQDDDAPCWRKTGKKPDRDGATT